MSVMIGSDPPWGLIEALSTALATAGLGASAFVWRLATRFEKASVALEWQKAELTAAKQAGEASNLRLAERLTQLHDEHCRLREITATLPTRGDLRDMEERLIERMDALAARIDHALGGSGA
ncbi:MAG TPA: hypothetical protein VKS78_20780 [Roseiarcus sp.]|nr:hypothetical protein [Roseiarcus sp.]